MKQISKICCILVKRVDEKLMIEDRKQINVREE